MAFDEQQVGVPGIKYEVYCKKQAGRIPYERTNEQKGRFYVHDVQLGWQIKYLNDLIYIQTVVKSCQAIFLEGSIGRTVAQSRTLALGRGLKLHATLLVPLSHFLMNIYLGIDMIIKHLLHFRTE